MQDIQLTVDKQNIRGKIFYPEKLQEKNPAILFIHGWMSDYEGYIPRAKALMPFGYIILIFDLRGHGKSDGKLGEVRAKGSLDDAIAAYDYLANLPEVDKNNISVAGSSYGSYIAALLVGKRKIRNIALRVPAIYQNETFNTPKVKENKIGRKIFRQSVLSAKDNFALDALSHFAGNLLLIESEKDEVIPHQIVENYKNSTNSEAKITYVVMKGADHSITKEKWKKDYIDILGKWFGQLS